MKPVIYLVAFCVNTVLHNSMFWVWANVKRNYQRFDETALSNKTNPNKAKNVYDLLCILWMEIDRRAKKQLKQNLNQNQNQEKPKS